MDRLGKNRQEGMLMHRILYTSWLIHDAGEKANDKTTAEVEQTAGQETRDMAWRMAFQELPRRYRRALGERGYNFGWGSMAIPKGV